MGVAAGVLVAAAVVAAAGTAYSAYNASEERKDALKQQQRMARWQAEVDEAQAEAARKQARMKADRHLQAMASKAGGAGVEMEGSLLVSAMEAASLAQYEEDLAAYGHELSAQTRRFEDRLFGATRKKVAATQWQNTIISGVAAGASTYAGGYRGGSGTTIATSGSGVGSGSQGARYDPYYGPR